MGNVVVPLVALRRRAASPVPGRRGRRSATAAWSAWAALGAAALVMACGGSDESSALADEVELGRLVFNDTTLSASGRLACASCHAASAGHAQDNALPAQLGGTQLTVQGDRVSPSIRYLAFGQPFSLDSGGTPSGGFFWDGRASSLADQAGRPFLNPREMALGSRAELVDRLAQAPYAERFRRLYGQDIFTRIDEAFERTTQALAKFQQGAPDFSPFSSKYDEFLRGNVNLTTQERRGLALFNDPLKGNCQGCHPSVRSPDGRLPLFTNFTYHALGVPRNAELAANADPAHFDLGLCAREAGDLVARRDLCGAFKVPSLRNVALRQAFFHNGRFTTLEEVVDFYVRRDTHPESFYPRRADGGVDRFDDLPPDLRGNVRRIEAPYDRLPGAAPALSADEVADVVALLHTLTDGWKPDSADR